MKNGNISRGFLIGMMENSTSLFWLEENKDKWKLIEECGVWDFGGMIL
jgi:hypothetical protein